MEIKKITVDGDYNNIEATQVTDFYEINEPLRIVIEFVDGRKILINTKRNYMTDYMSIPAMFEWFVAKNAPFGRLVSVVHDVGFNWQFESILKCGLVFDTSQACLHGHL